MNLEKALGAGKPASVQKISLYLPERDSESAPVSDIEKWIEAAMWLFGEINRGATRLPVAQGYWKPTSGEVVREPTHVVYSYIGEQKIFEANLDRLVRFIHSFGKHAKQNTVMVEFSGEVGRGDAKRFVSRALFYRQVSEGGAAAFCLMGTQGVVLSNYHARATASKGGESWPCGRRRVSNPGRFLKP